MPKYVDAENHLRALNGMMAAPGVISLWTCLDLPRARSLVGLYGAITRSDVSCNRRVRTALRELGIIRPTPRHPTPLVSDEPIRLRP
jgi:hypothetical protein